MDGRRHAEPKGQVLRSMVCSTDHSSEKVIIVTGGNSGTGYATCKAFYDRGATVYMAARSEQKANEAIAAIKEGKEFDIRGRAIHKQGPSTGRLEFLPLDLADLHSVERFVAEFKRQVSIGAC